MKRFIYLTMDIYIYQKQRDRMSKKVVSIYLEEKQLREMEKIHPNRSAYIAQLIAQDLGMGDGTTLEILEHQQERLSVAIEQLRRKQQITKRRRIRELERHLKGLTYNMKSLSEGRGIPPSYFHAWSERVELSIKQIEHRFKKLNPEGYEYYIKALAKDEDKREAF